MPEKLYEMISLAARYWFALLGVIIVWQSFTWLRRDRREKHRRLRQLPDTGMIGEMVVLQGSYDLPEGTTMPIPREGTLGYLRTCDVVVPVSGVRHQHCDFTFVPGKGLMIFPRPRCSAGVDGEPILRRRDGKMHPMQHGSRLQVGDALLRLRVFVGLEVERRSAVMADEEEESTLPPEQADWQDSPYVYHQVPADWATGPFQPVQPYGQVPPYDPSMPYGMPNGAYPPPYGTAYPPVNDPYGQNGQAYPPQYGPYDPSAVYPPYSPVEPDEAFQAAPEENAPRYRRRAFLRRRGDDGEA